MSSEIYGIACGYINAGKTKKEILELMKADKQLKDYFAVNDAEIEGAINDAFFIHYPIYLKEVKK